MFCKVTHKGKKHVTHRETHKVLQGNFLISSAVINFEEILDELSWLCWFISNILWFMGVSIDGYY